MLPLSPSITPWAVFQQYALAENARRPDMLAAHPELLQIDTLNEALSTIRSLGQEKLRPLRPDPADVMAFKAFAAAAYELAAIAQEHACCAEAAHLLAETSTRHIDRRQKDLWGLVCSVHTVLTYPQPKFSSTFDIIVSTTQDVIAYDGGAMADAAEILAFFEAVAGLSRRYIGDQAVNELVKFLIIPHNEHAVAVVLLYLAVLHGCGADTTPALPALETLAPQTSLLAGTLALCRRTLATPPAPLVPADLAGALQAWGG